MSVMSYASLQTEFASDLAAVVLSRWRRKVPAIWLEEGHALILLSNGSCELIARDGFLDIAITAGSTPDAAVLEQAFAGHFEGLAAKDGLKYQRFVQTAEQN